MLHTLARTDTQTRRHADTQTLKKTDWARAGAGAGADAGAAVRAGERRDDGAAGGGHVAAQGDLPRRVGVLLSQLLEPLRLRVLLGLSPPVLGGAPLVHRPQHLSQGRRQQLGLGLAANVMLMHALTRTCAHPMHARALRFCACTLFILLFFPSTFGCWLHELATQWLCT